MKFKQCPNAHLVLQDVNIEISSISILLSLSSQVIGKRRHVKVVVTKLSCCVSLNSVQQSNYHADYVMINNYVFTVFSFFLQILYRNVVKKHLETLTNEITCYKNSWRNCRFHGLNVTDRPQNVTSVATGHIYVMRPCDTETVANI